MLGALLAACGLMLANVLLEWGQAWIQLVFFLVLFLSLAYNYRRMWKATEPRAKPSDDGEEPRTRS